MFKTEVAESVRKHLEAEGYEVSVAPGRHSICIDISARRDKDTFFIEALGEKAQPDNQNVIFALGKLIMRMKEQGFWIHYGIAIPRSYLKFLKEFEVSGFEVLKIHVFLVENFYTLTHLDPQETVKLILQLKSGEPVNLEKIEFDQDLI